MIKIGTRTSRLAMVQTEFIRDKILRAFPEETVEIVGIQTKGDIDRVSSLASFGGKGVFTREIEEKLLAGEIDLAVHSAKDIPMEFPDGLTLGAVVSREDPRDVLVTRKGTDMKCFGSGSVVGTSSLRRELQIRKCYPGVTVKTLRGNVPTRLEKLRRGEYDGIILAAAGLKRLGLDGESDFSYEYMNPREFLPAAGQGMLALEIREGSLQKLMETLEDKECSFALEVERGFLRLLGGGCNAPCGVLCQKMPQGYLVWGMYARDKGMPVYGNAAMSQKEQAESVVEQLAKRLQTESAESNTGSRKGQEEFLEKQGEVFLVGAGPGRKEWLTIEALDCVRRAEVILYDALISPSILNEAPLDAELIYVGKRAGSHAMRQEKINTILAEKAREGRVVVRLKGGDPFIFGRGGEESLYLGQRGISCHVLSGVSSAYGVPARMGIPVTHRGKSASFHVITGHTGQGTGSDPVDYAALAGLEGTLVFLMGLGHLEEIVGQLLMGGKSPQTPVAVISQGGTAREQKIISSLDGIVQKAAAEKPPAPAVIVVGDVVELGENIFRSSCLPLQGKRVLLTGTRDFLPEMEHLFERQGAETVSISLIETIPYSGSEEIMGQIFGHLLEYQWIVFASGNGVKYFFEEMKKRNVDQRKLGNVRFAVVGRSTARKLFDYGYQADFVPSDFRSATLEQEWGRFRKKGEKILLVGGKSSLFRIRESLEQQGCTTETAVLYETVVDRRRKEELNRIFRDMDYVTLASGSAAKALAEMLEEISLNSRGEREAKIVVIGPETAEVCCRLGISVDFTAEEHTGRGIVQTVVSHVLE